MKKHRSPHGKENAIQKPGHPDTNTARDDLVFFDGWREIWGKLPLKIVRVSDGAVLDSRIAPTGGDRRQRRGKSRRSCTYTTWISRFLPLYTYYMSPQSLPAKADQRSAIHPRPPNPRTTPNGQAPRFAQTKFCPSPFHKSFARLFQKPRSPRSPRSPVPRSPSFAL